jgi:hypothetical protein
MCYASHATFGVTGYRSFLSGAQVAACLLLVSAPGAYPDSTSRKRPRIKVWRMDPALQGLPTVRASTRALLQPPHQEQGDDNDQRHS